MAASALSLRPVVKAEMPYICDAELSARLTAAKATPKREWLGGVSAVVLQQALGIPGTFRPGRTSSCAVAE